MNSTIKLLHELQQQHEQMATLADRLDWESITQLWQATAPGFVELRTHPLGALQGNDRIEACESLHKLLTLQNQMLGRIIPWMEQVRPLLQSLRKTPATRLVPGSNNK